MLWETGLLWERPGRGAAVPPAWEAGGGGRPSVALAPCGLGQPVYTAVPPPGPEPPSELGGLPGSAGCGVGSV